MKHVEQAGLVKFDFLGLTTLTILRRAVGFLRGLGVEVDLDRLPLDDPQTYAMLPAGRRGRRVPVRRPGDARRAPADASRPLRGSDRRGRALPAGPMANIPDYCRRKHGEAWEAPHPEMRDILEETYGIMVYQEQVMQIAQLMAGYSLGAADLLRRAMGKKIRAEMEAQRRIFVEGATARGIAEAKATEVFELMAKFADYGFNKSHAAAYALVAYQTAWMKANHPVVFMAACMSLACSNTDRLAALKQEAERMGIRILPPDINRSGADFAVERQEDGTLAIRYALAAVKKVGFAAMQSRRGGARRRGFATPRISPPGSIRASSTGCSSRTWCARAPSTRWRRTAPGCSEVSRRCSAAPRPRRRRRTSGQIGLFGGGGAGGAAPARRAGLAADGTSRLRGGGDRLPSDRASAGRLCGVLRRLGVVPSKALEARAQADAAAREAGRGGHRRQGAHHAHRRPDGVGPPLGPVRILRDYRLQRGPGALARPAGEGSVVLVSADLRLRAKHCASPRRTWSRSIRRRPPSGRGCASGWSAPRRSDTSARLLGREGRGKGRVVLVPRLGLAQSVEIALPGGFNVTPRLAQALKVVPGVERVEEI